MIELRLKNERTIKNLCELIASVLKDTGIAILNGIYLKTTKRVWQEAMLDEDYQVTVRRGVERECLYSYNK